MLAAAVEKDAKTTGFMVASFTADSMAFKVPFTAMGRYCSVILSRLNHVMTPSAPPFGEIGRIKKFGTDSALGKSASLVAKSQHLSKILLHCINSLIIDHVFR